MGFSFFNNLSDSFICIKVWKKYNNIYYMYMKIKEEYLDSKICFMGKDQIVRFIDKSFYRMMYNSGFDFMFDLKKVKIK